MPPLKHCKLHFHPQAGKGRGVGGVMRVIYLQDDVSINNDMNTNNNNNTTNTNRNSNNI